MAIVPVVGRLRGTTPGTAGTTMIHGIGIPGTGAIRSTIPRGIMDGVRRSTIQRGIRPVTITGLTATMVADTSVVQAAQQVAQPRRCATTTAGTTTPTAAVVTAEAQAQAMWA